MYMYQYSYIIAEMKNTFIYMYNFHLTTYKYTRLWILSII